jgi:hypothetical protein
LDPWYLTGFVEGEGAFTFSRNGKQLALYFAIKLTAQDSLLLEDIQSFFGGIGRIYSVVARAAPTPGSGHTKAARLYRVCRRDELPRIIEHFDRYPLRGTKAGSYAIWREMVVLKLESFRRPDREQMESLAARLSAASIRNRTFEER